MPPPSSSRGVGRSKWDKKSLVTYVSVSLGYVVCMCICCFTGENRFSLQTTKQLFKVQLYTETWQQKWWCTLEVELWEQWIFSCMLNIKGARKAEIRGKKKKSGQYKTNTCSFPGEKSCHCTPLATPKGEGKFTLRQGFRRMKQSRITTATSAGITGLVSLGSLAVLGTIFEKLNRCVWNVLFLSGI